MEMGFSRTDVIESDKEINPEPTDWLEPLKFVGIAMLLSGIGLALATIVRILRWQANRIWDVLSKPNKPDPNAKRA